MNGPATAVCNRSQQRIILFSGDGSYRFSVLHIEPSSLCLCDGTCDHHRFRCIYASSCYGTPSFVASYFSTHSLCNQHAISKKPIPIVYWSLSVPTTKNSDFQVKRWFLRVIEKRKLQFAASVLCYCVISSIYTIIFSLFFSTYPIFSSWPSAEITPPCDLAL